MLKSLRPADDAGMDAQPFPRDNLVRALPERTEVRESDDGGMPVIYGHFARFDTWNEIDSVFEGRFMESIAPGAFKKTFREGRDRNKILFQHGRDPVIGDKPIASVDVLREDEYGPYYEGRMLDTAYNRELIPGLQAGVYGASYRFRVMREEIVNKPEITDWNPEGLPLRTIKEAQVLEEGPVTFPADVGATAGVRSLTDWYRDTNGFDSTLKELAASRPKELARRIEAALPARSDAGADTPTSRKTPAPKHEDKETPMAVDIDHFRTEEDMVARLDEVQERQDSMNEEFGTRAFTVEAKSEWEELKEEKEAITERLAELAERKAELRARAEEPRRVERTAPQVIKPQPENIYDKAAVYRDARSPEHAAQLFKENALRSVEGAPFPNKNATKEDQQTHVAELLDQVDTQDAEIARRILTTGSPAYRRAFGKWIKSGSTDGLSAEERAVMAEGAVATGGAAIVYDLDPTIVKTSNGAVNPFRRVCRIVSISGTNEWRAVTSGAVVATYEAESTAAVDRSPTLAQPPFLAKRAQSLIDFSIELEQDWGQLQSEMAGLIQDSKDTLEAAQFATGVGTTVFPQGMTVGFTNTATTGTTVVLAVNDIYKTEEALPPRFRANAQWFANRFWYNKVRQLDTAGGANLWVPDLRTGIPANETGNTGYNLIGYPANEASGFAASLATTTKEAVLCAPNFYVIVERVGMNIEFIPHFFDATTGYPTGRRLLYAMWRNTARVLDASGGITLVGL